MPYACRFRHFTLPGPFTACTFRPYWNTLHFSSVVFCTPNSMPDRYTVLPAVAVTAYQSHSDLFLHPWVLQALLQLAVLPPARVRPSPPLGLCNAVGFYFLFVYFPAVRSV
jgi:hypothetical protein